jgi:osmotically-inducible protein OsmY
MQKMDADAPGPDQSQRSDEVIHDDLRIRLVADTRTGAIENADRITIEVRKGVVTLTGAIESEMAKRAAGEDAWQVPGVTNVYNNLRIIQ